MKRSHFDTLLHEINELAKTYSTAFDLENDYKALQGVERCIELKIKLFDKDEQTTGKDPDSEKQTELNIDLSKLSKQTLSEILQLSKTKPTKSEMGI